MTFNLFFSYLYPCDYTPWNPVDSLFFYLIFLALYIVFSIAASFIYRYNNKQKLIAFISMFTLFLAIVFPPWKTFTGEKTVDCGYKFFFYFHSLKYYLNEFDNLEEPFRNVMVINFKILIWQFLIVIFITLILLYKFRNKEWTTVYPKKDP